MKSRTEARKEIDMPELYFPYINIALDSLGLIVILIIFFSCLGERIGKSGTQRSFLILLPFIILALAADIVAWSCEAHTELSSVIIVSNTVASSAGYLAIVCFMCYLKDNLCRESRTAAVTMSVFGVLCILSIALMVASAISGYGYVVDEHGHYVHRGDFATALTYLQFPTLSFLAIVITSLGATAAPISKRVAFISYTVFPVAGIVIDYTVHGISLAYLGFVMSALIMYTNIHVKNQRLIEAQRNALMLSQINPHFVYNTLSTIAAMCELSPRQAKNLTISFASYLRQNINSLSSEGEIPFDEEMKHVECYLGIEKARFGDRLRVAYSIGCRDFYLPPLTLQPIVENAVKHGITKKAEGGTLRITTYATDTHHVIEVIDDGAGFDTEQKRADEGRSIGLENVRSRLYELCRGRLTVKSTVGVGTRVTVEIPKKKVKR